MVDESLEQPSQLRIVPGVSTSGADEEPIKLNGWGYYSECYWATLYPDGGIIGCLACSYCNSMVYAKDEEREIRKEA